MITISFACHVSKLFNFHKPPTSTINTKHQHHHQPPTPATTSTPGIFYSTSDHRPLCLQDRNRRVQLPPPDGRRVGIPLPLDPPRLPLSSQLNDQRANAGRPAAGLHQHRNQNTRWTTFHFRKIPKPRCCQTIRGFWNSSKRP